MANRTTRITDNQFQDLTDLVRQVAVLPAAQGRPIRLTLQQQVRLTVMYLRTNVTQEFLSEMFGISQPTASRTIIRLTPVLAWLLKAYVLDPEQASKGTTLLIDGTLAPCWSWKAMPELYSGKHKTTGHTMQVASDLKGRLVYLSPPLPGKTHDAESIRQLDIPNLLTSYAKGNVIGDKGYQGCGIITPKKKPQGREMTDYEKANNTPINRLRAVIERVIATIKTWRIMHTDYRRPENTFEDTLNAIRGLIFFQLGTPL
jgi:DDE superfamily endonuclease/Helix-turn-helix of DDE superfamily endonuclease